jgi:hypothetical protein
MIMDTPGTFVATHYLPWGHRFVNMRSSRIQFKNGSVSILDALNRNDGKYQRRTCACST